MSGERNRNNKLKEIPLEGVDDIEELTVGNGHCKICNRDDGHLRRHYQRNHEREPLKKKGDITEIPEEGIAERDVERIVTIGGFCNMPQCKRWWKGLRKHYRNHHLKEPRKIGTISTIPEDGNVDVDELIGRRGSCEMPQCKKTVPFLKTHFINHHYGMKIIPTTGDFPLKEIYAWEGECERCNGTFPKLRTHYRKKHAPARPLTKCHICNAEVLHIYFHLETHSGPAKCSVCHVHLCSVRAVKSHISRSHDGGTAQPILLEKPEAEAYTKAAEENERRIAARASRSITRIEQMSVKLHLYEVRLKDPSSDLCKAAASLKKMFDRLFELPDDPILSVNSSYISVWNGEWKIPFFVYEYIRKDTGYTHFNSALFATDPKVGLTQPTNADYLGSNFHKGHLAAAADFDELYMVAPTYYFSNVVPMTPALNCRYRLPMERHIRDQAREHEGAEVIHFPLMNGPVVEIGMGVRVPTAVATVMILKTKEGEEIYAWELQNTDVVPVSFDLAEYERDPFDLMEQADIEFKLPYDHFVFCSENPED